MAYKTHAELHLGSGVYIAVANISLPATRPLASCKGGMCPAF